MCGRSDLKRRDCGVVSERDCDTATCVQVWDAYHCGVVTVLWTLWWCVIATLRVPATVSITVYVV